MHHATSPEQQIVSSGRRLAESGMVVGSDGNISARTGGDLIAVTPSGRSLGSLSTKDLVAVYVDGKVRSGRLSPTSELALHLFVYARRPDVGACVHSHAPHATAFAVAGRLLPDDILPEVAVNVGPIALTPYAAPGTEAVPQSLEPYIDDHNAFLLRSHGLVTLGSTVEEALARHETVEHFARILYMARQLGTPGRIPPDDQHRLEGMRRAASSQEMAEGE